MANMLKMAKRHAIIGLLESGWSYRRIARELCVDRETVARYDRLRRSNPAISPPGSPASSVGRDSLCKPFTDEILKKLDRGLSG